MSIYGTWLTIEDERQWIATLQGEGIKAGVIRDGDPDADDYDAPIIYQGSHVLPSDDDPRGGAVYVCTPANHITRDGRDDRPEDAGPWPYIRLGVYAHESTEGGGGDSTIVLTRRQVERLHTTLGEWLAASKERDAA